MCGVFATTERQLWQSLLPEVLHMLGRRGPEASSHAAPDPELLLGHTRLEIIGLGSPGQQPLVSSDETVTVVFNGEIYNYRDLGRATGHESDSDTAVLAELLAGRRTDDLAELRGMFAFAAWDRTTSSLVAMRDPFGIKPLYVLHHGSGGVTLCSELAPLLLCPESRRIDDLGLANFLAFGHTGPVLTMFESIRKLVPGRLYRWARAGHRWSLTVEEPTPKAEPGVATLREAMHDSVAAHLIADVEVGAFMSSGVDSTLLAAIASRLSPGLRTFTLAFPETPHLDESELAARNAVVLGTKHVTVPVTHREMAACATTFIREHGEPFGDAAALPLTYLARAASEDVKVVLCGEGADELFGGYKRYAVSKMLPDPLARLGVITEPIAGRWGLARSGSARHRAVEAALWGGGFRGHAALLDGDLPLLRRIRPDVHRDLVGTLVTDWAALPARNSVERARQYDTTRWLPNVYLEKTDRATMSASLEARVPFLDPLVTAAATRTDRRDQDKSALRALLAEEAPGVRVPTDKRGLSVDMESTVLRFMSAQYQHELQDTDSLLHRWVGLRGARQVALRARRSPYLAFRVAMLGLWEEQFDGKTFACS
jgi:asparagine synthase (glutamine-hydrolysing)